MFLTYDPVGPILFSLRDEARNTERHANHQGSSGIPLRYASINFVCAGPMDPHVLLLPREPQPEANSGESSPLTEAKEEMKVTFDPPEPDKNNPLHQEEGAEVITDVPQTRHELRAMVAEQARTPITHEVNANITMLEEMDINKLEASTSVQATAPESSEDVPFVVDVCITKENNPRLELDPQLATPAPVRSSGSASSGEEIVFVPKKQRKRKTVAVSAAKPVSRPRSPCQSPVRATTPPRHDTFFSTAPPATVIDDSIHTTTHTAIHAGSSQDTSTSKPKKRKAVKKAGKEKQAQRYTRGADNDFDDEVVADYIANTNMEELEEFVNGAGRRDIGGDNMDVWLSVSEDDGEEEDDEDQWDEYNLEDFDAISTADEGSGRVHKVLRKRHRPSGLQYLIQWEGTSTDDATWILAKTLDSAAEKLAEKFEEREHTRELLAQSASDSGEGDGGEDGDDDGEGNEDDDQYLRQKKSQEEADYKLACMFATNGDSDVLDDLGAFGGYIDDDEDDDDGELDDFFVRKASGKVSFGIKPKKGKYPSASKMANAFSGEWDPMDWASPSNVTPKKKKKKGKAKRTQWDLSDDELKAQLRTYWNNDKKVKDKKTRHIEGMSMAQVDQEIHDFLMKDCPSLVLPPMDSVARKAIHNAAYALNLKSKSRGSGENRFPTLFKTRDTDVYIGNSGLIMQRLAESKEKSFFPTRGGRTVKEVRKLGRVSVISAGMKHRDGYEVGGHAPEIGLDNKGRRMLEKMGYKAGMGLGAEGKGMVTPIIAVVKTGRAGLR